MLPTQSTRLFVLDFTLCGPIMRLWQFNRIEAIACLCLDINKELKFVSAVLGYPRISDEQLGYYPTTYQANDQEFIDIIRNNRKERLILDELIRRTLRGPGRATTCWEGYREGIRQRCHLL